MTEDEAAIYNLKRRLEPGASDKGVAQLLRDHAFSRNPEIRALVVEVARKFNVNLEGLGVSNVLQGNVQAFDPSQTGVMGYEFNKKMDEIAKAWGDELEKQGATRDVRAKA